MCAALPVPVLLMAGAKGKRFSLPSSTIHMHQPLVGGKAANLGVMIRELGLPSIQRSAPRTVAEIADGLREEREAAHCLEKKI